MIKKEAYARAGLIGNPSDGFRGKTISLIVKNFKASVKLKEQERLEILPNSRDRLSFEGVNDFMQDVGFVREAGDLVQFAVVQLVDLIGTGA